MLRVRVVCALALLIVGGSVAWRLSLRAEGARASAPLRASGSAGGLARWSLVYGSRLTAPTLDTGRTGSGDSADLVVTAANSVGSALATSRQIRAVTAASGLLYGSTGGPYSSSGRDWPGARWQPYAPTSWANTPLPSWKRARLYSGSSKVISYMSAHWAAGWTPWTFSNSVADDESSAWGHPLYFATRADPLYTVNSQTCTVGRGLATFCPTKLRIPDGARHASGSDGHMEVVEPASFYSAGGTDDQGRPAGEVDEVDFFSVANGNPLSGGGTISSGFDGALKFDGSGCCGFSTAMNQGLAGLMIRAQDLARDAIGHALGGSFRCSNGTSVAPWPLVGGGGPCPGGGNGPPIGGRLQLKMNDSAINALSVPAWQKAIYTALAHYGLYVTDTGGSPMDPEFEPAADYLPFGNRSHTLMTFFASVPGGAQRDPYTYRFDLPWSNFQIVDPCYAAQTC
jgi:hypothetical protein